MAARTGSVLVIVQNGTSGKVQVVTTAPVSPAFTAGDRFDVSGTTVVGYNRRFVVEEQVTASAYNCFEPYTATDASGTGTWTEFIDPIRVGPLEAGSIDAGTLQAGQLHPG